MREANFSRFSVKAALAVCGPTASHKMHFLRSIAWRVRNAAGRSKYGPLSVVQLRSFNPPMAGRCPHAPMKHDLGTTFELLPENSQPPRTQRNLSDGSPTRAVVATRAASTKVHVNVLGRGLDGLISFHVSV